LRRTYQIKQERAVQKFRRQAEASGQQIQFALAPPEVLELVQEGLMNLALAAFTKVAEQMMDSDPGSGAGHPIGFDRDVLRKLGLLQLIGQDARLRRISPMPSIGNSIVSRANSELTALHWHVVSHPKGSLTCDILRRS
jgi:hypothetical protein